MSNLLSIHNSKNQVGIGTNNISVSSSLTIKKDSKRYIVFNTTNDSIDTHRTIELEDETTLSTVKTNSISSPKLLYIASNSIISSLSFSSSANTYLRVSNTGGLGLVDKIAPIVQSISATDGTYGFTSPNNIIDITVTFNETVTVTGTPSLTLSNSANANYISGDNSTSILFRYTIQQSDTNSSSLSVSNLSGTIEDLSGNPCTSINGTLGSVVVDTTIATVVSFIISNTSLKIGETATVTLQFSESVSGFNSDNDITEQNGSLATMTSSDNITWTGTFTPTDDIEDTTNILQLATSYTDSAGNSGPTAQTANYSIDTKEPILSNASSIGTTTDTTPTFSFTSSEAGTIISSLGFSTSNTAIANSNSITFNTLSNNTYSSQWVKVIDAAGNTSNQLLIPSFTVTGNPYVPPDIRYYMWNQNPTLLSGETRGEVGYILLKALSGFVVNNHVNGSSSYTVNENYVLYQEAGRYSGTNDEGVGGYNNYNNAYDYVGGETSKPFDIPNSISSRDSYGVRWGDNTIYPDEHIYKIVYAGSNHGVSNTFKIRNTRSLNWIPYYNTNGSSKSNPTTEETYFELKNNNSTNNTFQLYMPDRSKYFGCDYYLNGSTQSSLGYGYYREKSSNTTANINFDWRFHFI